MFTEREVAMGIWAPRHKREKQGAARRELEAQSSTSLDGVFVVNL